jgi:hypothetical protein
MEIEVPGFADPTLSANIYAEKLLDDVFSSLILPLSRDLKEALQFHDCSLWTMRYRCRGEHLKLRLHVAPDHHHIVKQLLEHRSREYFLAISSLPLATLPVSAGRAPALDVEDQYPTPATDRTLLWTTYRRLPVSLPGSPWVEDNAFVERACRALASGCGLFLAAVASGFDRPPAARQQFLSTSLIAGLRALGFTGSQSAAEYLRYHRDWLLRFFIAESAEERRMLSQFNALAVRDHRIVEKLSADLAGYQADNTHHVERNLWSAALSELAGYMAGFSGRADYLIDPFASDVSFAPVFKVFHGLANQAGVLPLQEAYVHHLLLTAAQSLTARWPDSALQEATW